MTYVARHRMGYGAKVISLAVALKAVLMASVVTLLASTTFGQSLILVLVSATATGIFGVLIVLIQVRSERNLHARLDTLERRAAERMDTLPAEVATTITEAAGGGSH